MKEDRFLLEYDVHEQTISHRIALYLEDKFPEHNVDCEYNNDLDSESGRKQVICGNKPDPSRVRPDIIVHRRGLNGRDNNLLIVEIKKLTGSTSDIEMDRKKIKKFLEVGIESHYEYLCGALVTLGVKSDVGEFDVEWFSGNDL